MPPAKRAATFRLNDELIDGLQQVKDRHGVSLTDQITRAIELWLRAMEVPIVRANSQVETRLVERRSGIGQVVNVSDLPITQTMLKDVTYDLAVWQEVHQVRTLGGQSEVEGLKEVTGQIQVAGGVPVKLIGVSLMLVLDNGQRFKFFFQDNHGAIAPQGGIV